LSASGPPKLSQGFRWKEKVYGAIPFGWVLLLQSRGKHPLLPLRLVLHRQRGGSFLAVGVAGAGIFTVFLFSTYYYLQNTLGFSPRPPGWHSCR
jgi:hypothetical protein